MNVKIIRNELLQRGMTIVPTRSFTFAYSADESVQFLFRQYSKSFSQRAHEFNDLVNEVSKSPELEAVAAPFNPHGIAEIASYKPAANVTFIAKKGIFVYDNYVITGIRNNRVLNSFELPREIAWYIIDGGEWDGKLIPYSGRNFFKFADGSWMSTPTISDVKIANVSKLIQRTMITLGTGTGNWDSALLKLKDSKSPTAEIKCTGKICTIYVDKKAVDRGVKYEGTPFIHKVLRESLVHALSLSPSGETSSMLFSADEKVLTIEPSSLYFTTMVIL